MKEISISSILKCINDENNYADDIWNNCLNEKEKRYRRKDISNSLKKLEKLGFDVIGLEWKNGKHTKVIHNIAKPLEIDDYVDIIIHLAARLEHERCSKEEFFNTNVDGTEQLLNLAHSKNAYFLYVSTTAVYGSPESPITANTPVDHN